MYSSRRLCWIWIAEEKVAIIEGILRAAFERSWLCIDHYHIVCRNYQVYIFIL